MNRNSAAVVITRANGTEKDDVQQMYLEIAKTPGGIIRKSEEIHEEYIAGIIAKAMSHGLMLVAKVENKVVGEIHAITPQLYAFQHLLADLTIMVHPRHQGKGIGRGLFEQFLEVVQQEYPYILRVELYVREHNRLNVQFYTSLGFQNEGRQKNKIFVAKDQWETPLHMVWFNPNYKKL